MVYCRDLTPCNHYKLYPPSSLALCREGASLSLYLVSVLGAITRSAGGLLSSASSYLALYFACFLLFSYPDPSLFVDLENFPRNIEISRLPNSKSMRGLSQTLQIARKK